MNIINLEEPLAGKRPDYSANSVGVGYRIATETEAKDLDYQNGEFFDRYYKICGIAWYDLNENRYVYSDETFIKGHVYTVYIDIVADSAGGYEFVVDKDDSSQSLVYAYVDGFQALAVAKTSNPHWNQYVEYIQSCQNIYEGSDDPIGGGTDGALLGDVTGDGKVNSLDAAFVLRYDAGLIGADELNLNVADVTKDGKVSALDAAFILRYDAGLVPGF